MASPKYESFDGSSRLTVTFANNTSVSTVAEVGGDKLLALLIGSWTSAVLTFRVSADGVSYFDLYDQDGAEVTIATATQGRAYAVPLELLGFPYVIVRSGTGAAPVTQTNGDDITFVMASN